MDERRQGKLVVVSGPSGVGKGTLVKELLKRCPLPLTLSVSATTRSPRPGEQDGRDYHFLTREEFDRKREGGQLLECFEVFDSGHWYGTLESEVAAAVGDGSWIILEVDVQGAFEIVRQYDGAVSIFVKPPSFDELEKRLRGRKTEDEAVVRRRLEVARSELKRAEQFQYQVVNETVDQAVREICDILTRCGDK
jgi:guanylate kinase